MLERLAQELPALFGYYNVVFVAKAALATLALSAVGCLVGTALALGLVLVRLTSGWTSCAAAVVRDLFRRGLPTRAVPGHLDAGLLRVPALRGRSAALLPSLRRASASSPPPSCPRSSEQGSNPSTVTSGTPLRQ